MKRFFITFLVLCSFASAAYAESRMKLKEKLSEAIPGSYLVIEQNKTYTFLHVFDKTDRTLVIEEVSIPAARFAQNGMNWKEWFESGAPGHTSWMMSQINLQTGQFEETFSYTHQGWIDLSDSNPFLTTLLNLTFYEIPESQRRRIGRPPPHHKADTRPFWNPRLIVDNEIIAHSPFIAWKGRWPADGSDLSRKIIEIYLPYPQQNLNCPTYFPYWLEVEGKIGSAKVRVIDSGMDAASPKGHLPRRAPQLIGQGKLGEEGLVFHLKSPPYFKEFIILAEESGAFFGNIFPLPCQTSIEKNEIVKLVVPQNELEKLVNSDKKYRFTITPKEDPNLAIETEM